MPAAQPGFHLRACQLTLEGAGMKSVELFETDEWFFVVVEINVTHS